MRKRFFSVLICACAILSCAALAHGDTKIPPAYPVPDEVSKLLKVASEEVGYHEGEHGRTKYGEWVGDPYAQWCAEFLCWCVDQTDQRYGTQLLRNKYPMYSGQNTGRNWFIKQGRYVVRKGPVDGWGYEWLKGEKEYIKSGSYIPQPGDWVFFTWTNTPDTDHVAMVEYCTKSDDGKVKIHVIEGNNPTSVQRAVYDIDYNHILGYGTYHDVADITMHFGNDGEKVRQLQEKLVYLGLLDEQYLTGHFGSATHEAVKAFQAENGLQPNGTANIDTQLLLDEAVDRAVYNDPDTWTVVDDDD